MDQKNANQTPNPSNASARPLGEGRLVGKLGPFTKLEVRGRKVLALERPASGFNFPVSVCTMPEAPGGMGVYQTFYASEKDLEREPVRDFGPRSEPPGVRSGSLAPATVFGANLPLSEAPLSKSTMPDAPGGIGY